MSDVTPRRPMSPPVIASDGPKQDFVGSLGTAARENPAAAALIAMGAVWLFAGGSKVSIWGGRKNRRSGWRKSGAGTPAPAVLGLYAEGALTAVEDAADNTGQATRRASEKAGGLTERGATIAENATDAAVDIAGTLADGMSSAVSRTGTALSEAGLATSRAVRRTAGTAWGEAEDLAHSVREVLEARPLSIAALGLAAGAGLALVLPRTEVERSLLGEQSEALRERARTLATGGIDDVREGGEAALARAMSEARANGITEDVVKSAVEEFTSKLRKVALAAREGASG